jgi:hypothetical protein
VPRRPFTTTSAATLVQSPVGTQVDRRQSSCRRSESVAYSTSANSGGYSNANLRFRRAVAKVAYIAPIGRESAARAVRWHCNASHRVRAASPDRPAASPPSWWPR